MKWAMCTALLLALVVDCSPCRAEVFERDWKSPGDGLLTFDDVNQREWLDLSQTLLQQFPGTTIEDRYQSVVGEIAAGGLFEGFTVAKSADVVALAQSAGIDTTTEAYVVNAPNTLYLSTLLSFTFEATNENKFAIGLVDEIFEMTPFRRASADFLLFEGFGTQAGLRLGSGHSQYPTPPGVFLYRAVPEPTTASLVLAPLFFLLFRRTKR